MKPKLKKTSAKGTPSSSTTPVATLPQDKPLAKGTTKSSASSVDSAPPVAKTPPATKTNGRQSKVSTRTRGERVPLLASTKKSRQSKATQSPDGFDQTLAATPTVDQAIEEDLMKKPAGSLQSDIRIFQIYYESWQRELLDPAFASLDNASASSELLEFDVFRRLASSNYVKDAKLWGALSWRFAEKTGMSGQDLLKVILANPDYDVYFCNPVPENEALYHNLWVQGETSHPQFLSLTQAVFQAAELPLAELSGIESDIYASAANYFIATPKFWALYLPWIQQVLAIANKKLPPKVRDLMHSSVADDRGLHGGATYVPFIVERLFPLFMKAHAASLKSFKVTLPERERELNVHLKLLREMKEISHKTKSAWLAACWVNYRNLYLTQARGQAWCQQNLANITPKEIRFI